MNKSDMKVLCTTVPRFLTTEYYNPKSALTAIFDDFQLNDFRQFLDDCFYSWMADDTIAQRSRYDYSLMKQLHGSMHLVTEAAFLINRRNQRKLAKVQSRIKPEIPSDSLDIRSMTFEEKINKIAAITNAAYIYYLGDFTDPHSSCDRCSDICIIKKDVNGESVGEVIKKVQDTFFDGSFSMLIMPESVFVQRLERCFPFYCKMISSAPVYIAPNAVLPTLPEKQYLNSKLNTSFYSLDDLKPGLSFLQGAIFYHHQKDCKMTAYMLHQAIEISLFTVIKRLMDINIKNRHDIQSLLNTLRKCLPHHCSIYKISYECIKAITSAYTNARTETGADISQENTNVALSEIASFINALPETIKKYLL